MQQAHKFLYDFTCFCRVIHIYFPFSLQVKKYAYARMLVQETTKDTSHWSQADSVHGIKALD